MVHQLLSVGSNWYITRYDDDTVFSWYDPGIGSILELEEVMGEDNGENYDFDGNLEM